MTLKRPTIIPVVIISILMVTSCDNPQAKNQENTPIGHNTARRVEVKSIIIKKICLTNLNTFRGFLIASPGQQSHIYIEERDLQVKPTQTIDLLVVNKTNGQQLKKISIHIPKLLKHGNSKPFPSYIRFLNNHYYMGIGFSKIITLDTNWQVLYSSLLNHKRYFLDLFLSHKQVQFVMATHDDQQGARQFQISIYNLYKYRKITRERVLFQQTIKEEMPHYYDFPGQALQKDFPGCSILPGLSGFIKDGTLYYSLGTENRLYCLNLNSSTKKIFELAYLPGKQYSRIDNKRIIQYKLPKQYHKAKYLQIPAFAGPIYQLGILDVGKTLIGIIAEVDTNHMVFRLDIFQTRPFSYRHSLQLPCGTTMLQGFERGQAIFPMVVDIDRGVYIFGDREKNKAQVKIQNLRGIK